MKKIIKVGQFVLIPFSLEYIANFLRSKRADRTLFTRFKLDGLAFLSKPTGFLWLYRDFILLKKHHFDCGSSTPVIIDVGANTGVGVIAVCKQHPGARLWAIEADPELAYVLEENIVSHALSDNVEVINKAAWICEGELKFLADGHGGGSIDHDGDIRADTKFVTVPCFDLNQWLTDFPEQNIHLFKIDVEGAEYELLEHCQSQFHRFENVIIEVHAEHGGTRSIGGLIKLFENSGLYVQHIDQNTWPEKPMHGCTKEEFQYRDSFDIYLSRTA